MKNPSSKLVPPAPDITVLAGTCWVTPYPTASPFWTKVVVPKSNVVVCPTIPGVIPVPTDSLALKYANLLIEDSK